MSSTQIVEQVSAAVVVEPAKKNKVRKNKPHPLKGVLIDADLQEEIIVSNVVGEVVAEMVSCIANIPVVVAEVAVVVAPITPAEEDSDDDDDDEETTLIEINKLKEKLKKQKEDKRKAEAATEWIKTEEKYANIIKKNIVPYKVLLLERIQERKADTIDDMRILTERYNEQMEELKMRAEKRQTEYDCLKALDNDETFDCIQTDTRGLKVDCWCYALNEYNQLEAQAVAPVVPVVKAVAKKAVKASSSSSAEPTDKSKAITERKEQWKFIPEGTKLQMTYNKSGLIYTKTGETLVGDADGKVYKSMNDAIKKYKEEIGDNKSFGSAWSLFKVYDK